jgi:hypothetical protein
MKNVKLEKATGKGWFLTIGDNLITNHWAVTSLELWALKKVIQDNMEKIMEEIHAEDDKAKND